METVSAQTDGPGVMGWHPLIPFPAFSNGPHGEACDTLHNILEHWKWALTCIPRDLLHAQGRKAGKMALAENSGPYCDNLHCRKAPAPAAHTFLHVEFCYVL